MTRPAGPASHDPAALDLGEPLEEVWSVRQPHVPVLPVVADGKVFYGDADRRTTAIVEESGKKLWQSNGILLPQEWWRGRFAVFGRRIYYADATFRLRALASRGSKPGRRSR